jgi:hypothetical protein
MSKSHHNEALRWHWLYIPLVAFLVFAVGPSVLAPILFVLSLLVDIPIVGPVQRAPDLISILVYPLLLGLTCWPFLWLHGFARDALIEDLTPLGGPYRRLRDGSPSEPCSQPPITQVSI